MNSRDIRSQLVRLRGLADREIRSLSGPEKEDYQNLVNIVKLLYDTPAYANFHEQVATIFGDLERIQPGTVGAYFGGCLTEKATGTCSIVCAGQMPLPNRAREFSQTCPGMVILALPTGSGYTFQRIYSGKGQDLAIFIDSKATSFTGFNSEEIAQLHKLSPHARKVHLLRYTGSGNKYDDLSQGLIPVENLPTRMDTIEESQPVKPNKRGIYLILALLLVGCIALISWKLINEPAPTEAIEVD